MSDEELEVEHAVDVEERGHRASKPSLRLNSSDQETGGPLSYIVL